MPSKIRTVPAPKSRLESFGLKIPNGREFVVTIPHGLEFADLQLAIGQDGCPSYNQQTIKRICAASGLDFAIFNDFLEGGIGHIIHAWYMAHRSHGGAPDPVEESLLRDYVRRHHMNAVLREAQKRGIAVAA